MSENNNLNSKIGTVEATKNVMTSTFREGLIKFSETAPQIVGCQGHITTEMKHSVDTMYQNFKRADVFATDCNNHISTALELSAVLVKKIKEKKEEVERDIRKHEREKDDAENDKKRSEDRVRDAKNRVSSAKEDVKKADKNRKVGWGVGLGMTGAGTAAGCALGAVLGGPVGLVIGGSIMGGVYGTGAGIAIHDLEKRVDEAESDLSSKEWELTNKESELTKIRDKIRDCENELKSINECLDQIGDLDAKVRRGQVQVANLSTHIKNCLTVIRTTVGKSKMLRDECLSEIVNSTALVKIVNDLALHFKAENLGDFLSVTQNDTMTRAIRDIERTSCGSAPRAKRVRVKTPYNDFMDA